MQAVRTALRAGAGTINVPDTVGYATPGDWADRLRQLRAAVPELERAVLSVHCHDDLGHSVSNSMAAVRHGARQVECTINGIGERAGNASLEEVVMTLKTRPQCFQCDTAIEASQLYATSQLLSKITAVPVQPNKAIVGDNAFAHEAGIHQDGVLKNALTYEIMTPESVGVPGSKLVLGKHSGRNALRNRPNELGFTPSQEELQQIYNAFTELADAKKNVHDSDLIAIARKHLGSEPSEIAVSQMMAVDGC